MAKLRVFAPNQGGGAVERAELAELISESAQSRRLGGLGLAVLGTLPQQVLHLALALSPPGEDSTE